MTQITDEKIILLKDMPVDFDYQFVVYTQFGTALITPLGNFEINISPYSNNDNQIPMFVNKNKSYDIILELKIEPYLNIFRLKDIKNQLRFNYVLKKDILSNIIEIKKNNTVNSKKVDPGFFDDFAKYSEIRKELFNVANRILRDEIDTLLHHEQRLYQFQKNTIEYEFAEIQAKYNDRISELNKKWMDVEAKREELEKMGKEEYKRQLSEIPY